MQVTPPAAAPARPAAVIATPGLAPPLPSNVVPFRRSAQLLRTGMFQGSPVDTYQQFLDQLPDIDPQQSPGLWAGLVPDPRDPSIAAMIERPVALHEHSEAREDPVADAWGTRPPASNVLPLVGLAGGGGGGGSAA